MIPPAVIEESKVIMAKKRKPILAKVSEDFELRLSLEEPNDDGSTTQRGIVIPFAFGDDFEEAGVHNQADSLIKAVDGIVKKQIKLEIKYPGNKRFKIWK